LDLWFYPVFLGLVGFPFLFHLRLSFSHFMWVPLWLVFSRSSFFGGISLEIRLVYFFSSSFLRFALILPAHISALRRAVLPICVDSTCAHQSEVGRFYSLRVGFAGGHC
jgi:hypothetical protein